MGLSKKALWKFSKGFSILILVIAIVLVVLGILLTDTIPPHNMTITRMWVTKRRIIQYTKKENHLPQDLSILPDMPGYDTETNDGWGRPLFYEIKSDGKIVLKSYGRDGRENGIGEDKDIIRVFEPKDSLGKWNDELTDWVQKEN